MSARPTAARSAAGSVGAGLERELVDRLVDDEVNIDGSESSRSPGSRLPHRRFGVDVLAMTGTDIQANLPVVADSTRGPRVLS
jgi:hypothetical protein